MSGDPAGCASTSQVPDPTSRAGVVELSRQMSSCKDLVMEPSQLGSLKQLNGTRNMRVILVRPLTVKVKAYVQFEVVLIRVATTRS